MSMEKGYITQREWDDFKETYGYVIQDPGPFFRVLDKLRIIS